MLVEHAHATTTDGACDAVWDSLAALTTEWPLQMLLLVMNHRTVVDHLRNIRGLRECSADFTN